MDKKWRLVILTMLLSGLLLALGNGVALAEPEALPPAASGRVPLVKFTGVVVDRPEDTKVGVWVIDGRQVQVTDSTVLDETQGQAVVGALVQVIAKRLPVTDPEAVALGAIWIRVLPAADVTRPITIRGWVTELESDYLVVNRLKIWYDDSTEISGELALGVLVNVVAVRTSEGLKALKIEVIGWSVRIVEFEGVIEYIGQPAWIIGGQRVKVTRQTTIIGQPQVGLTAKVRAIRQPDGILLALRIEVQNGPEFVEWTGLIERLPPGVGVRASNYLGRWVVGGREVWVTRETEIVGTPRIGLQAHVQAVYSPRQPLTAKKIEVLSTTP